ncbi:MAG: antitoxin VbhA family protein [Cellulomonadaceae bacterium]|nr:antitoxin VbhA family protein [Cellulomonadaceae bacterium]
MARSTVTTTTEAERERRVAEAIHSGEMEGVHVSPAGRADAQEYVAGRIDSDELVARARARYGLD